EVLIDLRPDEKNRAKELIEDFMIAANGVTARYLARRRSPSLRRVLKTPERWSRIVELARELGEGLPATPDARALERFLAGHRAGGQRGQGRAAPAEVGGRAPRPVEARRAVRRARDRGVREGHLGADPEPARGGQAGARRGAARHR